ncbi:gypsy type transposase [Tanacetum coccineum]|uniref:Gypsy type transposase n=1 Tax=Tanacetum coccineum TaxID=301880 RepID=A0ABQ5FXD0_9ASTR
MEPKTKASLSLPWKQRLILSVFSTVTGAAIRGDGSVNRRLLNFVMSRTKPTSEPINGVKTHDVVVDPTRKLWFRVFVPTKEVAIEDLPVIVYFHGGGFTFFSPDAKIYDDVCRRFAREWSAIVVSVDYRLAPEHRYPAQHNDCFDVLRFLDDDENKSKWLPADANISRCFLAGDSAGGNLAHHVAQRACEADFQQLKASPVLGFPSISLVTVGGRSGSLVGQGSTYNRVCGRECSSAVSVCPRRRTGAVEKILTCVFEISGAWPFITSLKCVLTQEHLDAICAKYFVPEEVHPQLPSSDATMHERPAGKVGMYTRFFDYANYRIPFSTFFVSVLTHFRIPFSQLSVFGSAKVSHFEILCRVCNIEPDVSLFRYFYTHNYKNGWFGFTKRPNVRACYSKNLDSVKNWNDHFFWVDEFVVPANARFNWFSGSNIVKDRAPAPSEYNVEHVNALIAQASPFLRFPEEFLCWVGISRNYLLNKDTYPRFEYEDGEVMDLNAFIRTADPRKVRIVERPRAENEGPIVTVAKHRTVTLLPTSVVRSSGELSASVEREFVGDASVGDGGDKGFDSVTGQDNVEPSVPVTEPVEAEVPKLKRSKKKRVIYDSEGLPVASHPPKRLKADYGTTGGSVTRGKSHSVLNRLLQDSRLTVEQGVPALPTLPFITSSVTASFREGGESYYTLSAAPVMIEAITVATVATTVAIPADGRGSGFDAGSIRAKEAVGAGSEEIYVPEWTVTKGFEMNDGRLCANMIDHFTPPAFFKTVRGIEHEQLFTEFNVSAARNLSLSSEVRMRAEYNILEKRKWRSLAGEKDILLEAKDKEIEDLKSQLLKAKEESAEVAQLRDQVSGLEATENSLRGEVGSTKDHGSV